jgi:hypothetical protein
MAMGTKSRPSASDRLSKVNRSALVKPSRPTVASSRPRAAAMRALSMPPLETVATSRMPSSASIVYSGGPKSRANSATRGATRLRAMMARVPPTKEPMAAMPRAVPALPWRARAWPSKTVTTEDASPGRRNSTEVMVPPYWAP